MGSNPTLSAIELTINGAISPVFRFGDWEGCSDEFDVSDGYVVMAAVRYRISGSETEPDGRDSKMMSA